MFVFKWFRAYLCSDQRHELYLFSSFLTFNECVDVEKWWCFSLWWIYISRKKKCFLSNEATIWWFLLLIIVGCIFIVCIINSLSTALNQLNVKNACRQGRFLRIMIRYSFNTHSNVHYHRIQLYECNSLLFDASENEQNLRFSSRIWPFSGIEHHLVDHH